MGKINVWYHHVFDVFTRDEKIIILVVASLYLHYVISIAVLGASILYLLKERRIKEIVLEVPRSKFVLVFCLITTLIALLYKNWLGAACGVGILFLFIFIFYYRTIATKRMFEMMLEVAIVVSMFCVGFAIVEYAFICNRIGHSVTELFIANSPKNRVHVGFFNANYYAMMIEFTVLMIFYKGMQWKSWKATIWYTICAFANLFALLLTGCRTAWVPFVISVPILILCCHMVKLFAVSIVGIGGVASYVLLNPTLMKRAAFISEDFAKRERIWTTAMKGIQAHPLFGQGPLTYYQIYPLYDGHPTQHAHNVFLDPILSHGVICVLIIAIYFGRNLKEIVRLATKKIDLAMFGLIVAFIITVLVHGLLDYTVYWVQTGALFLILFSSSSIYFRKNSKDR